jgi:hypothetical protein
MVVYCNSLFLISIRNKEHAVETSCVGRSVLSYFDMIRPILQGEMYLAEIIEEILIKIKIPDKLCAEFLTARIPFCFQLMQSAISGICSQNALLEPFVKIH